MNAVPGQLEASNASVCFTGPDFRILLNLKVPPRQDVRLGIPEHDPTSGVRTTPKESEGMDHA